jgi:hypothetical protein
LSEAARSWIVDMHVKDARPGATYLVLSQITKQDDQ